MAKTESFHLKSATGASLTTTQSPRPSGIRSTEATAIQALDTGQARAKFQRICEAQGGMRVPPTSRQQQPLLAEQPGIVQAIDNRRIARLAKLAGAPEDKAAGIDMHVAVGDRIVPGQPLCTVHADSPGELAYALDYAAANRDIVVIREP